MNNFAKFFLGFFFIVIMFDLMLIDRKKNRTDMINLFATFNKIDGLNIGDNVMISGISVGFVNDIILENSYPKISMMVDENLNISRDSSISIQTDGLFGSKFLVIEIGGHTDNSGSKAYNLNLSDDRARSVKDALVQRGIPSDRIQTKGYGMSVPLNTNSSEQERALNRRTELKIIAVE